MNYLRKNAKVVMVFMCVVCMITFVVGTALIDLVAGYGARQADNNPVALTWTKGSIREADLNNHSFQRRIAWNFLYAVIQEAVSRGATPIVNGQPVQKGRPISDVGIPGSLADEDLVETMVMAEEARRLGIAVDQAAVEKHLRDLSFPELNEGDWLEIADRLVRETNAMMTVGQLFERLAFELKAQHVRVLANAGLLAIPPGDMWNYFNRLNRRFSVEAYPIDVAPLMAQVKSEPTASEIQTLFDDGKYRDPNPMLPDPGFRKPHKVAFTYVRVDFAPFLEAAKKTITDEQIKEQYDKDIAQGLHKVPELPADKPADDKKDEDKKEADKKEEEKKDDKPADDKEKKEEPTGTEEKKGQEEKKDDKAAPSPEDACQEPEKKSEEPKADDKKADEKKADEKKDDKPADEKKEDEKKPEEKKEPKFKPLEEVKEEIRTKLAQPIAQDARNKAVKEVTDAINDYGRRYRRWLSVKEFKKDKAEEPAKLDIEAIASKHGFKVGTTPLVDRFEIEAYDIGKEVMSFDMEALRRGDFRMQRFADIAFADDETLYDAKEANSTVPDVDYLYYRTAEEKGGDVKLADVRQQVVEAWKKKKAFDLAMDDAKKLAEKAKGASTLNTVVTDATKVITPPPFSWMTSGSVAMGFGEPELSQVTGVELAGQEFMKAVFALQPGQAGAAPNQSRSKVYVVRVVGQDPVDDVLRTQFLDTGLNFQVIGVARRDMMQTTIDWYREVEKRYSVTWLRPPRDFSRRM
jgi:hypothetical protein